MNPFARKLRQSLRPRRGTEILEAAFVFPFLLLFVFGTVEYGYYFHVQHTCAGAAREGARAAIPPGTSDSDVTTAVETIMSGAGFSGRYSSAIQINGATGAVEDAVSGDSITVVVTCSWGTVGVSPLNLIGNSTDVIGTATMRKEGF